jgi:rhodanese-related sulfurtransferase
VLPHRPSPAEALRAQADGAVLVDIRGDYQRRDGLIPGALVVPRNSLEWRCDPASEWRHPAIARRDLRIILVCQQGYQSSLAAATLQQLGLVHATDLAGGFTAWTAAGLPAASARGCGPVTGPQRARARGYRLGLRGRASLRVTAGLHGQQRGRADQAPVMVDVVLEVVGHGRLRAGSFVPVP